MTDKNILKENAELTEECKLLSEQLKLRDEALADLEAKNETLQKDLANQSGLHSAYASTAGDEINKLKQDLEISKAAATQAINKKIGPKVLRPFFDYLEDQYKRRDDYDCLKTNDDSKLLKSLASECVELVNKYYSTNHNYTVTKESLIKMSAGKITLMAMKIFNSQLSIDKTPLDQMVKDAEQGGFYD